jgi:hypothetical protein
MTPDITITVHDNTPLEFKSDIYRMNTDGDTTYQIIPLDDPDGFNADWNPDTHVFRIWHYDVVDHVSEHRAGDLSDAVELLRRYLNS